MLAEFREVLNNENICSEYMLSMSFEEESNIKDLNIEDDFDDDVKSYIRDIMKYPVLSTKEMYRLASRAYKGDKKASDDLIKSNFRTVVKIAKQYNGIGLSMMDIIQEGNIGLMKAVEEFDPLKSTNFVQHSFYFIRNAMVSYIRDRSKMIRIPDNVYDLYLKINKFKKDYFNEKGVYPNRSVLLREMGASVKSYEAYSKYFVFDMDVVSLCTPINDEDNEDCCLQDCIPDDYWKYEDEINNVECYNRKKDLLYCMERALTVREYNILYYRFGFDGTDERTLEELASMFCITRESVRHIIMKGLRKLRHYAFAKLLKDYSD